MLKKRIRVLNILFLNGDQFTFGLRCGHLPEKKVSFVNINCHMHGNTLNFIAFTKIG